MTAQFRKIVVGIDFSDASLAGARWVSSHLSPEAELLLVHVVPLPKPPLYLSDHMGAAIDLRSSLAPRLHSALRAFADLLGPRRVRVGIRTGVPWSALARVASEVNADLICVARGHKRQGSSRFGGTTPQRLLATSRVPVLVIPQTAVTWPARVFAALSGRSGGERIVDFATGLAADLGSRLEGVHVVESEIRSLPRAAISPALGARGTAISAGTVGSAAIDALDESVLRLLAREWLASAIAARGEAESERSNVRMGDAGQELITVARETPGSSVIVMGTVGESDPAAPSPTQLCGSTTRMVLWAAPGPVLVVPLESEAGTAVPIHGTVASLSRQHYGRHLAAVIEHERMYDRSGADGSVRRTS